MKPNFVDIKVSPILNVEPKNIRNTYELYNQAHYWRGRDGWYSISSMTADHRRNVLRLILKNAHFIRDNYFWSMPYPDDFLQGEMALELAHAEYEREVEWMMARPADNWIRYTPLFIRMQMGVNLLDTN